MKVIISAGGTGGHIYPALAIINKIKEKEPNSEFLYIGTHNRMEKDIVPNNGIPFESIEMYGFNRKKLLKTFKTIKCLFSSYKKCKKLVKEFNPDVVIGVGGYVTVPVIVAAKKLGYKTVIHEQNSVPGASNEFLEKKVDKVLVSFKSSIQYFDEYKIYSADSLEVIRVCESSKINPLQNVGECFEKVNYASKGDSLNYTHEVGKSMDTFMLYNPSSRGKSFYIEYILKNVVVGHNDINELRLNMLDSSFNESLDKINIKYYKIITKV